MATEPEPVEGTSASGDDLPEDAERREFLVKASSVVLGGAIVSVPAAAGLSVFFAPLLRKGDGGVTVKLTTLESLPVEGDPQQFSVEAERVDAWTRYRRTRLGNVYLRRASEKEVIAFNASCPHAGCAVGYDAEQGMYTCPCHFSLFAMDGEIANEESPAARGLDALPVEVREDGGVWVTFRNFVPGIKDKKPV